MSAQIQEAVARIRGWGEVRDWRGYDPYDALNSPAVSVLSRSVLGRRLLTQGVKLSPVNLRPFLGIRPAWNHKAIALVASGYARIAGAGSNDSAAAEAERWLTWLVENRAAGSGMAWGYHFPVQTRVFHYGKNAPNTIATSFAAQALLDGVELLGQERWSEPGRAAATYLTDNMLFDGPQGAYFRYLPGEDELVHNANLLACAVLGRAGRVLEDRKVAEPVAEALGSTLEAQREDGSWPYADVVEHGWVDNFHTGYVLESLAMCEHLVPAVREPLQRGLAYWERSFFLDDGTPKYFPHRVYPIDAHCYAQAIETWLAVADWHPPALAHAERTARLLIDRMLDPSGYVYFQQRRFYKNKVPFIRWSTAPAFRALAGLLLRLHREERPSTSEVEHARLA